MEWQTNVKTEMDKPPYYIPSMAEIAAIPWNGYNAISTFSGCGGSSLGYKMAGFRILWASEFIPAAAEVYRLNHPDTLLNTHDIRDVKPEEILEQVGMQRGQLDLLDGSPPCASFSTSGTREAGWDKIKVYSETRQRVDDLFFEYARILRGLQPKVFVAENVSGLIKGKAKGYFKMILRELKDCGYLVSAKLLDAQWLGVPQQRQRIIFVGVRKDLGFAPVQLGAINDPCDHIERQQGWLLEFIKLAAKYNQPVRISTKGTVFQIPEYQRAIAQAPHLFWIAFSIITPDDELIEQTDRMAPNATERLKTMKILSDLGCSTSLRFRPILPGLSDSTPRYPKAYRTLIEKAAEAGAKAISYEVGFVPGLMPKGVRWRWQRLSSICDVPYRELYRSFGTRQACMRPPAVWTENIMHAIAEVGHEHGMTLGVSDPVWKQLTDTGCCCGILPDDPVFGNWEVESATNQLLIAKNTGKILGPDDIIPEWANSISATELVAPGVGPKAAYVHRHIMWTDKLRELWNNPEKERSPLNYFQGALMPDHRDENGDLFYHYEGLQRQYPESVPFWKIGNSNW